MMENINHAANALLETITPANDIEYYITRTSEIYLNNLNELGVFEINDEILLPEIRSITVLNGWDYGRGVYMARAMMDTVIEFNMPEEDVKYGILANDKVIIYPNPSKDFITIQNLESLSDEQIKSVEFYNLLGTAVKEYFLTDNILDISSVQNGVYLVKITLLSGQMYFVKLEILR
ncbi:MAG: T9SS type A sorting domain-containing protein [Chitinophagales bacterium]